MRRFLICIVFAVLGLMQLNAQIQRTFFGYSFGSSKQVVLQGMRNKGYIIDNISDGFAASGTSGNPIKFGGHEWEIVLFSFQDNKLYEVFFGLSTRQSSPEIIKAHYDLLLEELDFKYAKYNKKYYKGQWVSWNDSKTEVDCRYSYHDDSICNFVDYPTGNVTVTLDYSDINERKRKLDNDNSEL